MDFRQYRMPTTAELTAHLNGKSLFKGDYWAPVADGTKKDYIQIGDGGIYDDAMHRPGKSHLAGLGWPAWADNAATIGHTGVHKQAYCIVLGAKKNYYNHTHH